MKFLLLMLFALNANAAILLKDGKVQPIVLSGHPIKAFVKDYAELTGSTITAPDDLFRKDERIQFAIHSPVTLDEFKSMFYGLLDGLGYTVIDVQGTLWIHNGRDIRYLAVPIVESSKSEDDSRFVMAVHQLKFPISSMVARNLRPFMSRYGRIIDFSDARTLIISDTGDNIHRLVKTIQFMDTEQTFKNLVNDVPKIDPDEIDPSKEKIMQLELDKKMLEKKLLDHMGNSTSFNSEER